MEPFQKKDQSIFRIAKWEQMHSGLKAGFTTRSGGVSEAPFDSFNLGLHVPDDPESVIANRRLLAGRLNIPLEQWVFGEQIHQTRIKEAAKSDQGKGAFSHQD